MNFVTFHLSNFLFFFYVYQQALAGIMAVALTQLNLHESNRHRKLANTLTHISLSMVFIALFCDVIKMNFGLDPAVPIALK